MNSQLKNTYLAPKNTENPKQFPVISQPKIVGSFSLNGNREYVDDTRNCKYIYKNIFAGEPKFDLNDGIESVIRKIEASKEEKINHLLHFILKNIPKLKNPQNDSDGNEKFLSNDFVCFRGLLRLLMCSPYEYRDPWIILATKFKGTIYLCAKETEKHKQEKQNENETMKKILSYGFKFEQFVLTDNPLEEPTTNVPVDENEEFCCMFSTTLAGQKLLYGAEMDGIETDTLQDLNSVDLNQFQFIEMKVKLREQHERQKQNYLRFKLRNWWCQSFLANVKKIVVGTRDKSGVVDNLSVLNVKDIPKQNRNYWSPSVCMEFLNDFLRYVSRTMTDINDPKCVCSFEYDPTKSEYIFMRTFNNHDEYTFLPSWFIEEMNKQCDI